MHRAGQVEPDGRNNEQVHGGDVRHVIMQEGAPSPGWWSALLDHLLGDAGLRNLKPKLKELANGCAALPTVGSPRSSSASTHGGPPESEAALLMSVTSSASSSESLPDANAQVSRGR